MKKTQIIELYRNIRSTKVSFIAIIAFVALGIAFFTGLSWSADGFLLSTHNEVEDAGLYDAEIVYPYGFSEEDVEKLAAIDGVDEIEGFKSACVFIEVSGKKEQIKINQTGNKLNRFAEIDGVIPKAENEIAIERTYADTHDIKTGDTVKFDRISDTKPWRFQTDKFVVTAIVVSPLYVGKAPTTYGSAENSIAIDGQAFVSSAAFKDNPLNTYSSVSIRSNALRGLNTFSQEYSDTANELLDSIDAEISDIMNARYEKICSYMMSAGKPVEYGYTVTPRMYNSGIIALKLVGDSFYNTRFSMAALFLIVGLLVCYSAVTRIVHDQAIKIGTKKALGMSGKSITAGYLIYSGLAVFIGGILSLLISVVVIEPIMYTGVGRSFIVGKPRAYCTLGLASVCFLGELILILLCTFFACRTVLKRKAIDLLVRGEENYAKSRPFEKTRIWKQMPLFYQTIIKNCLNNKRRVFATIIGIAGCASLIVCAITMNDNIQNSFDRQYSDIFLFDHIVYFMEDESDNEDSGAEIQKALYDHGIESTALESSFSGLVMPDGQKVYAQIFVPLQTNKDDFIRVIPCGETEAQPGEGVWMNVSYAKEYDAKAGDTLKLVDMEGRFHDVVVSGFYENYMTKHQLILSADAYRDIFGKEPESNSLAFLMGDTDPNRLEKELSAIDGFVSLNRYKENSRSFFSSFTSVSTVLVSVYLVMSVAMALLVLLNLYAMFVEEKKKESIVMMINGYSRKQIKIYLNRDSIFLSVIGIMIGLVVGTLMAALSVHSFESSVAYFLKEIDPKACIIAVAGSSVLSFLMMKIALHRVDKFTLSDINKP